MINFPHLLIMKILNLQKMEKEQYHKYLYNLYIFHIYIIVGHRCFLSYRSFSLFLNIFLPFEIGNNKKFYAYMLQYLFPKNKDFALHNYKTIATYKEFNIDKMITVQIHISANVSKYACVYLCMYMGSCESQIHKKSSIAFG